MNVTLNTQTLVHELRLIARVVASKPPIPILSHVLLDTADGRLRLSATDIEIGLKTTCPATITTEGRAAVHATRLLALVERLPHADVVLMATPTQLALASGAFRAQLSLMSADDFPPLPEPSGTPATLDAASFQRLIARTRYAVAEADTQRMLRGALLKLQAEGGAMIATDGKRLAVTTVPRTGAQATVMIPIKTLDVLASAVDADVEMTVGERTLFFRIGQRLYISRMLEGEFPNYEPIIPKGNDLKVIVNRGQLIDALRRVVLLAEDSQVVTLSLTEQTLTVSSASADAGSATESLSVQYTGPALTLNASGEHLLDFLDAASGADVTLALKDERSAILLMDGATHLGVVAVMR